MTSVIHRVLALTENQGGIASRRQLYGLGVTRGALRAHLRARRWRTVTSQTIAVHNGIVGRRGRMWAAVLEGGPRAHLDGTAALVASGLERFTVDLIRVSVPRGVPSRHGPGFEIRATRWWQSDDRATGGIPRTRPAIAAVRGALWARTDREASYILTAVVQQGLARPEALGTELLRIKRHRRRLFLHVVVNDLLDGGRALGELDVSRELRARGLPAPQRQVLRKDKRGRYYLDFYWPDLGVVVEVDGIHHTWATNIVGDALRQNALALTGDTVLRLPLLGYRLAPDQFFEQIESALTAAARGTAA
jgi:very-short-patch-repair endonuclease